MSEPTRLVKQLVDLRDQQSCVMCGVSLAVAYGSRHHRKRRSQASRTEVHTPANLLLMCGSGSSGCHGWVHAHPAWAYEHGFLVHSWADPLTVPVKTFAHGWVLLDDSGNFKHFEMEETA